MRPNSRPWVQPNGLPVEERQFAERLVNLLSKLEQFVDRYGAAIALDEHSRQRSRELTPEAHHYVPHTDGWYAARRARDDAHLWSNIAIIDAISSVYHLKYILEGIESGVRSSTTLRDMCDLSSLTLSMKKFRKSFGVPERIRNAVQHEGEAAKKGQPVSAPLTADIMLSSLNIIYGDEAQISHQAYKGTFEEFMLSRANLAILESIRLDIHAALEPAAIKTREIVAIETAREHGII